MNNSAAAHYVNFRYGRIAALESFAEEFEIEERAAGCWALATHIKGTANVISDAGSRDVSFASRWNNDPFRDCTLSRSVMAPLIARFGPFDVDLFADRDGYTAQGRQWFHPEKSAFEAGDLESKIWAHPPRAIAGHALKFLNDQVSKGRCVAVLVLPEDPGAPWYRAGNMKGWTRRARWPVGAKVMRAPRVDGGRLAWSHAPPLDIPVFVISSW